MLTPQEVKPLLLHEDKLVRESAIEYLDRSWPDDPEIVPLLLQAYRQFSATLFRSSLAYCDQFVITEETLDDILDMLAAAKDSHATWHLNRAVLNAPTEVLMARRSAIFDTRQLSPDIADSIRQRFELSERSPDWLWEELQDYARRSEDKRYTNDIDHGYVNNLITAMAQHDTPSAGTICELLESTEIDGGWLEIFVIDLAGERRIAEAIPTLVDRYRVDTDYMLERVTVALTKIGDRQAVRRIRSVFMDESWHFKNFASGVLGRIKHQEAEDANLALLEVEESPDIRTMLCLNLCELFSEAGVECVRNEIRHGYDSNIVCLEEKLLPVALVFGIDIPEADRWRRQREEKERYQAERQAELAELGRRYEAAKAQRGDPFANLGVATKESKTLRNTATRISRNDLCPCGSGKKYKKCCARKPR